MGADLSYYSSEHLNVTKELVGLQQWWFRNSCGFWIGSLRSMELLSLRQHILTLSITYLGILFIMVMNTMCLIQQPQSHRLKKSSFVNFLFPSRIWDEMLYSFCSTTVVFVVVQADWTLGVCLLDFFKFVILITGRNFANKHTPWV